MTFAFTGSDPQYSPRLRDRQRSAEMAAKPQQQVEQDRIAELYLALLGNLREPNETRLGHSQGKPSGRGWGPKQALQLYEQLSRSKAVQSGKLKDLSDFELLIPGIGNDKISDLAINVIRGELTTYTEEQCALYDVPVENVPAGLFWNPEDARWESHYANLPVYKGRGLVLVPKIAVRRNIIPDYKEFYNDFYIRFLEAEHLRARDSLVYTLKNGNPKVYISDLKAKYKLSKDNLFDFTEKHPEVLKAYKKSLIPKAAEAISDDSIEKKQTVIRRPDGGLPSSVDTIKAGNEGGWQVSQLYPRCPYADFLSSVDSPEKRTTR
jgi:hypothetical protein